MSEEEVTILKNSIAKGATDTELTYLLKIAERRKLDPFKQQIWFVRRWDKNADDGKGGHGANVWAAQVGIDGLLFTAARDHKSEFGSISVPEFGPTVDGHPEWAIIKVWKKGELEPTVAQADWSEYAPFDLSKAPFWRKMPRRMLAKCATALAIRQAYPDLGGMYIPEEMERMREDYTPEGRQIVQGDAVNPGREAAQAVAQAKIAAHEARKAQETPQAAQDGVSLPPKAILPPKPVIDVAPSHTVTSDLPDSESKGRIEVDWTADRNSPIVRGDLANVLEVMKKYCKMVWHEDWWHCAITDVETIRQMCEQFSYKFVEILPNDPEPEKRKRAAAKPKEATPEKAPSNVKEKQEEPKPAKPPAAEPELIKGFVEQAILEGGDKPRMAVLFRIGTAKHAMKAWNDNHFKPLLAAKEKKLECEIFIKKTAKDDKVFTNIFGLKRVGTVEFDVDGKTPVVSVHREPGTTPTLFK
jgi:hypothetical protein